MYNFPQGSKPKRILQVNQFKGVDFASNPMDISSSRSPDALNIKPDLKGLPVSRHGYEQVLALMGRINGIYKLTEANSEKIIVHHGNKISLWAIDGTITELYTLISDVKSICRQMNNKLYIFDGVQALVYGEFSVVDADGYETGGKVYEVRKLEDIAYMPTTTIGRKAGTIAGGQSLEAVNLIGKKRKNSFCIPTDIDDTINTLQLDTAPIILGSVKVKALNADGDWVKISNYTVNTTKGLLTFSKALGLPGRLSAATEYYFGITPVVGMDNYVVEFATSMQDQKHIEQAVTIANEGLGNGVEYTYAEIPNGQKLKRYQYDIKLKYTNIVDINNIRFRIITNYQENTTVSGWFTINTSGGDVMMQKNWEKWVINWGPGDSDTLYIDLKIYTKLTKIGNDYILTISEPYGDSWVSGNVFKYRGYRRGIKACILSYDITANSYLDRINNCTIAEKYGYSGNGDRLFISGNSDMKNYDWWSGFNDPTYFPDLNYAVVGDEDTAIMGYSRLADGSLAIHKAFNEQDSSLYIRNSSTYNNEVVFPIRQGAVGPGVLGKRAFAYLNNEPLALSCQGVFAIVPGNNMAIDERYAQDRSFFINPLLTKEPNLALAEAIVYDNFYLLAIGSKVYLADSQQKSYGGRGDEYSYEWYLWDNIPARIWWVNENKLYFGTDDGKIMVFNDGYLDIDQPIEVYWTTPIFNFGSNLYYKKIKNVMAVSPPYLWSDIDIRYISDKMDKKVKWADLGNMEGNKIPQFTSSNHKAKKIMTLQLKIGSKSGKPWGLYDISIAYSIGGKYKG